MLEILVHELSRDLWLHRFRQWWRQHHHHYSFTPPQKLTNQLTSFTFHYSLMIISKCQIPCTLNHYLHYFFFLALFYFLLFRIICKMNLTVLYRRNFFLLQDEICWSIHFIIKFYTMSQFSHLTLKTFFCGPYILQLLKKMMILWFELLTKLLNYWHVKFNFQNINDYVTKRSSNTSNKETCLPALFTFDIWQGIPTLLSGVVEIPHLMIVLHETPLSSFR